MKKKLGKHINEIKHLNDNQRLFPKYGYRTYMTHLMYANNHISSSPTVLCTVGEENEGS